MFKAHLKWHRTAETEIVAVKTMKGILLCSRLAVPTVFLLPEQQSHSETITYQKTTIVVHGI